jgi:hypothetical protein
MRLGLRDALYLAGILLTTFVVGVSAPGAAASFYSYPLAMAVWLLSCTVPVALSVGYFRYLRSNSPTYLRRLLLQAHEHVVTHASGLNDMLLPKDGDPETARLLIRMDEQYAVITKQTWRGVYHEYVISPTGVVTRKIRGSHLTWADRRWLNAPLTSARLAYLVHVLRSEEDYAPRRRINA